MKRGRKFRKNVVMDRYIVSLRIGNAETQTVEIDAESDGVARILAEQTARERDAELCGCIRKEAVYDEKRTL